MSGIGGKRLIWTKERDEQLLQEISNGKTSRQISISMSISTETIKNRLKDMGFDNFIDAKNVMTG